MDWFDEFCEEYGIPESKLKLLKDKTLEEVIEEGETEHDKRPSREDLVPYTMIGINVRLSKDVIRIIDLIVGKHKNVKSRSKVVAFATKLGVTFDSMYEVKPFGRLRNTLVDVVGNIKDELVFEMANKELNELNDLSGYREKGATELFTLRPFWWVTAYISDFAPNYNVNNKSFVARLLLYYGLSRSEKYLPPMYRAKMIDAVKNMVNEVNIAYRNSFEVCKRVCWYVSKYDKGMVDEMVKKVKKIDSELYDELVKYLAMLDV